MDFFTLLDRDTIEDLRRDFVLAESGRKEGIDIYSFVRTLLKYWPTDNLEDFIGYLIDLFEIIDVDCSGLVSWEEFLDFCVEAGEYSTRARCVPFNFTYRQRPDFVDDVTSYHDLAVLKFVPEISYLMMVEEKSRIVKFLAKGCKCAFEICPEEEFRRREKRERHAYQRRYRLSSADPRKLIRYQPDAHVLCLEYITSHRQMVIGTLDGHISFWDVDIVHGRVEYNTRVYHDARMAGICHSKFLDMLFTWSNGRNDFYLYAWEVASKKLKHRIAGHDNTIKCALELSRYGILVTGGMDGRVIFWDLKESRQRTSMPGLHPTTNGVAPSIITTVGKRHHKHGIRALAFSPEHEVVLSVGFDITGYAWDTNSFLLQLKLVGHRSPLLNVKIVKHETERALTCDVEGSLRLWAIERSVGSKAICLALFDAHTITSTVRPKGFVVIWNQGVLLSSNGLYYLESIREKRKDAPLGVRFSESRAEFFVMMSKTAYVVDAYTGRLKKHFNNLSSYDITGCVIDRTCTRVFTADASGRTGIHRTINLNRIADSTVDSHGGEINSLVFNEEDNVLITVGADRQLHVYDGDLGQAFFDVEGNKVHKTGLLRSVAEAHEREINFVDFNYGLSLIATASADLTIRVWDFQRLSLESVFIDNNREISSLAFLSNYPLVLAGDVSGRFRGWLTRPTTSVEPRAVFVTHNIWSRRITDAEDDSREASLPTGEHLDSELSESTTYPITIMAVNDLPEENTLEVFTGDEWGGVKRWDFSQLVRKLNLKPVNVPAAQGNAYHPRQSVDRKTPYDGISRSKVQFFHKLITELKSSSKCVSEDSTTRSSRTLSSKEHEESQAQLFRTHSSHEPLAGGKRDSNSFRSSLSNAGGGERGDALGNGRLIKLMAGWEAHRGPLVAMELRRNPHAVITASADKSVKVFDWEGRLLGVILSDFGWYKERHRWTFSYDRRPSDEKLKCEVDKVLDGLDKSAVAARKMSIEGSFEAEQAMSIIIGGDDGFGTSETTPADDSSPTTFAVPEQAALQALIDMCLAKRAQQQDQYPGEEHEQYSLQPRRPSQNDKYPAFSAEATKQHVKYRPKANEDEAIITAYVKEREEEKRRCAILRSESRRPSSASALGAPLVQGNGVLIQTRRATSSPSKAVLSEGSDASSEKRPKSQAEQRREQRHAKMDRLLMTTRLADMPTNAAIFGSVVKSDKFQRCQEYLQRLEDGELDDREQSYRDFLVRLKAIMKQKKGPHISDKELAQVDMGEEWAYLNKKTKKRNLTDLKKNFQRERISAQTLDNKGIGRFGPYGVREVLDFITFFDFFDKTKSGDLSVGSLVLAPTYIKHPKRFKYLFEALGVHDMDDLDCGGRDHNEWNDQEEEDRQKMLHGRLIPMSEVLRRVFRYCKYEELLRIKNFVEISRLAETLFSDNNSQQKSLPPLVEHDLLSTFYTMEKRHCGTITVRDMCEILSYRGLLPACYTVGDMEREGLLVTACDANKELEPKDIVQLLTFFMARRFSVAPPTVTTR